jgi:LacI family transcriptional regulator
MAQRVAGFTRALRRAGVTQMSVLEAAGNTRAAGATAIAPALETVSATATAVFAVTDVLALGVLDAATAHDVAVPAQLSVVGFDDIAESATTVPPLTTVSQSLFEQGGLAAQAVLDQLAGRQPRSRPIRSEVVVRGSTTVAPVRQSVGRRRR